MKNKNLVIGNLIALLNKKENRISFVGSFRTNSIALYFQCGTNDSQEWLFNLCKCDELRMELRNIYRTLQPELKSASKFDIDIDMTNYSKIHSMDAMCHQSSGNSFHYKRDSQMPIKIIILWYKSSQPRCLEIVNVGNLVPRENGGFS